MTDFCTDLDDIVYVVFKTIPITRVLGPRSDDTPRFHVLTLSYHSARKAWPVRGDAIDGVGTQCSLLASYGQGLVWPPQSAMDQW